MGQWSGTQNVSQQMKHGLVLRVGAGLAPTPEDLESDLSESTDTPGQNLKSELLLSEETESTFPKHLVLNDLGKSSSVRPPSFKHNVGSSFEVNRSHNPVRYDRRSVNAKKDITMS